MADTYNKKALQQKRAKKKQDKLERREDRKNHNDKGKSLSEMIVYLDEFGNFTDVPPEKQNRKKVKLEDVQLGAAPQEEQKEFTGVLSLFFKEKSYGFITDDNSKEAIFVHSNNFEDQINEKDKVTFEREKTPKGYSAIHVRKIK